MSTTYAPECEVPWRPQPLCRPDAAASASPTMSPLEKMQSKLGWCRVIHRRRGGAEINIDHLPTVKEKKPLEDDSNFQWLPDDDRDGDSDSGYHILSPLEEMQAILGARKSDAFACLKEKKPHKARNSRQFQRLPKYDGDVDGSDSPIVSPLEEMQAKLGWSRVVHRRRGGSGGGNGGGERKKDTLTSSEERKPQEDGSNSNFQWRPDGDVDSGSGTPIASPVEEMQANLGWSRVVHRTRGGSCEGERNMDAFASLEEKKPEDEKAAGGKYSSSFGRKMEWYDDDADEERFRDSKYYMQRYKLFRRYDAGIKMDSGLWYSVTPELIARHIARRFTRSLPVSPVIVDAFCGAAGNTIQFSLGTARAGGEVIGVELSKSRYHIAQHNTRVYGADDSCTFILGNAYTILPEIASKKRVDAIFLSPPWGGPEYVSVKYFDLSIFSEIVDIAKKITPNVAILVPRNIDVIDAIELFGRCEIELNYLYTRNEKRRRKPKTVTIYFGDLVENVTTTENGPSSIELFDYDATSQVYTAAVGCKGFVDERRIVAKEHNYRNHFPELPTRKNDTDNDLFDDNNNNENASNAKATVIAPQNDATKFVRTHSPTSILPIPNGTPHLAPLASHRTTTLPPTISAPAPKPASTQAPLSAHPPVHVIPSHVKPPLANSPFVSSAFSASPSYSPSADTPPSTPPRARSANAATTEPYTPSPGFDFSAPKVPKISSPPGLDGALPLSSTARSSSNANACAASIGGTSVTTISSELNAGAPSFVPSTPPGGRSTAASATNTPTPAVGNLSAPSFVPPGIGFPPIPIPSLYALNGVSCAVHTIDPNTQELVASETSQTCVLDRSATDFVPSNVDGLVPYSRKETCAPTSNAPDLREPGGVNGSTATHKAPNCVRGTSEHFFPYGQHPDDKRYMAAPRVFAPPNAYMPAVLVTPNMYMPTGNMLVMPLVAVHSGNLQTEIDELQRIIEQQERTLAIKQYSLRSRTPLAFFNRDK